MEPIEQRIEGIVSSILQDYGCGRDIDKIDIRCHPDKSVIIDMIEKLIRIIFPGASTGSTTPATICPC